MNQVLSRSMRRMKGRYEVNSWKGLFIRAGETARHTSEREYRFRIGLCSGEPKAKKIFAGSEKTTQGMT